MVMKKILCSLIVSILVISGCMHTFATDGKVEISFSVGDETLIINGSPVTVEKPYVVGEGVTLVPIRVITEAFDAKVDWIAETKTVNLTYPDVNISIQIDNPVAEVNGRAETLLAAPELTESGFTMVPLRFISENFGAEVSYDNDTKVITVIKEKAEDNTVSIEGAVDNKYIGDSYLEWSMENPKDMTMEYRSFDGMETVFSDGENEICIDVYIYDEEDYDFESDYNEIKMSFSEFALVKTDKNTSDKNCMSFQFGVKDKNKYIDYQQYVTPDYIYVVSSELSNEDTSVRDRYLNILSTFKCKFEEEDIYNLSKVKDGFRRFESDQMKLSFDVPEDFYMASSEYSQNRFEFYEIENDVSSIHADVYSKDEIGTAKALAKNDYDHNKNVLNEKITTFSENITDKKYGEISASEYSYTVKSDKKNFHSRDVFFEIGDYIYNIGVTVELPNDDCDAYIDRILNSVKVEPLDREEVGVFLRNTPVATGTIKAKLGKATVLLPNIYIELVKNDNAMTYVGSVNGVYISVIKGQAADVTTSDLKKMMKNVETEMKSSGSEITKATHEKTINNKKYQVFQAKSTEENTVVYAQQYACIDKGYIYIFTTTCDELSYSESAQAEISEIINSIVFE